MKKNWQLIKSEAALDMEILKLRFDFYKNPRNNKVVRTIALSGQDAVNVIAKTVDNKIILVRQFRFGIGDYTLEIPGGMIDEGENEPLIAAKREMKEETGYVGENWKAIGNIQSNPVFMDSLVHHFYMENAALKYELELDEAEDVEIVLMEVEEVYQKIEAGLIKHPHTISAFHFARKFLLEK
jgi:8-oxo-dGTP pyrophosphatase MutT (NUDIX family)